MESEVRSEAVPPGISDRRLKRFKGSVWPVVLVWIGAALLLLSPFLSWLNSFLGGGIKGYLIPIFGSGPIADLRFSIVSFGCLGFILGLIGLSTLLLRAPWLRLWVGGVALLSSITFLYQVAVFNPILLRTLADHNRQYRQLIGFTTEYLRLNKGVEPTFWSELEIETLPDRIVTGWYFLSWGWYFVALGGSLYILGWFLSHPPRRRVALISLLIIITVYSTALLVPSVVTEYFLVRGERHLAQGLYDQAVSDYGKAREYDPGLDYSTRYRLALGEAFTRLNRTDQADYHLYRAAVLESQGEDLEAAFEYSQAKTLGSGMVTFVAENHLAWLYITTGLKFYKKGVIGAAMGAWEKAIEIDSGQLQAHYYLAKTFFDIDRYEEAVRQNQRFLERSENKILNANAYANLGDCYNKLQNYQKARESYLKSLALDRDENYRALTSLVGS